MPLLAKQDCIRIAIINREIMNKQLIYKGLKILFFLAGFPLLLMIMLITMAPMFNQEILGNHAANWMIGFCAIWAGVLIVWFVLDKFVAKKSETCRKIVLVAVAALSVICVLVPSAIYDAAVSKKYTEAYSQLYDKSDVKTYDALAGWHRDFTEKYKSEVYYLLQDNYDIQKMYGLSHIYSEWYNNADKENNLGYKYGTIEKAQVLTKEKLQALENYNKANAELNELEAQIAQKQSAYDSAKAAYDADTSNAQLENAMNAAKNDLDGFLAEKDADLVRLKGYRVDITAYKDDIVNILVTAVKDENLLPDGLTINIAGLDLDIGSILKTVLGVAGDMLTPETISGLVPDVIYTGFGDQTVSTYKKAVEGSDSDLSLAQAQSFAFKAEYYPSVLAAGAMKYACYVCVGLVVLSVFLTDYFARKEKGVEINE